MTAADTSSLDHLVVATAGDFRIRLKHPADFPDDYRWRCDPELARYDGRPVLELPFEEFERQAAYEVRYVSPWHQSFSIIDAEGAHVGNAMFYNVSPGGGSAELGILLGEPDLWGHGIGRSVMTGFVRYLWSAHPFRNLVLHTLEWNERAVRCFRRAGFEETARVFRNEEWFTRMEARREWWMLWDAEGRFTHTSGDVPRV